MSCRVKNLLNPLNFALITLFLSKNRLNFAIIGQNIPKIAGLLSGSVLNAPNYTTMAKNRKISTQEFDYLAHMEPYMPNTDKNGYKTLKYTLLETIEGVFGDKWFNLKESTRQAIDYICFLSIERGFLYASPDHIAQKHGIARSTVYDALKLLRDEGLLYKANRSSKRQNGLGCAVHFFTIHPYFDHINVYLNLGWKAHEKADRKSEIAETPSVTRADSVSETPTLSLPSLDLEKRDLHINVPQPAENQIVKYVPKEINALYAGTFNFRLRFIWQKITQAWKTIRHASLDRSYLLEVGTRIIKRIYQIWKDKQHRSSEMTVDEMCAFAYKATRDSIYNTLATEYMQDYDFEENAFMGEAVRSIPQYEKICLNVYPHYDYKAVKEHVIGCLEWGFRLLKPESLRRIVTNYERYSTLT
ncbi:hypothetical protein AAXB25_14750 [Paenibacillus lautus]|uniref:hypothetical protein n=1 Tax=Paenibacillus lautus TaxID=1401 RepID=UPI003D29EE21